MRDNAETVRDMMLDRLEIMQQKLMAQVADDLAGPDVMAMIMKIDDKIAKPHGIGADEDDDARAAGKAAGEGLVEALKASAPVLRPDAAIPANPML